MDEPANKTRKRIREACENCRRKKGRCTGERPVCALCARLGQTCTYADSEQVPSLLEGIQDAVRSSTPTSPAPKDHSSQRSFELLSGHMQSLEEKVTDVQQQIRLLSTLQSTTSIRGGEEPNGTDTSCVLPSPTELRKAARLYTKYCLCQPLPLLSPHNFDTTLLSADPEVSLCIYGVVLRFDTDRPSQSSPQRDSRSYLQQAETLVNGRITQGRIELSTLQCLCLLSFAEFNDGMRQRAGMHLALAIELCRAARLDLHAHRSVNPDGSEEHVRCLWSIILLHYIYGNTGVIRTSIDTSFLRLPQSDGANLLASDTRQSESGLSESSEDLGVVAYALQMSEAWSSVREFVHHRGRLDKRAPWSDSSLYAKIMSRQMELESQMPHKHRFNPSGFAELSTIVLSTNRQYWAPWLYLQILYHTIVCTLNHPLLLSLHLRRFRVNQIPELFLQHIADMISSHTDWFIHLIDITTEKEFEFSDPFIGQCAAIVATILLQQSYTDDPEVSTDRKEKYLKCFRLVQGLGQRWTHIHSLVVELQKFENVIAKAFESTSVRNGSLPSSQYVDLVSFWTILDNTTGSTRSNVNSVFGKTLAMSMPLRTDAEILSRQMLPKPTRVGSLATPSHSAATTPAAGTQFRTGVAQDGDHLGHRLNSTTEPFLESTFLAQDFFAIGQDFAGNADDWFTWSNT